MSVALVAAFLRRDAAAQASYRADLVLQLASVGFTLVLFFYLARIVDESTLAREAGLGRGYFAFAVVGLAMLQILQAGLTSFAARLRSEQLTGTLEALLATPTAPTVVILLSALFDLLRAAALGLILLASAVALFGLELDGGALGMLAALGALLGALALFSAAGVLLAAFGLLFKQTTTAVSLAITAIGLMSGVYFPLTVLPAPVQAVGEALPFTWAVDAMRAALLEGRAEPARIGLLLVSGAILLAIATACFRRSLDHVRATGSLSQY